MATKKTKKGAKGKTKDEWENQEDQSDELLAKKEVSDNDDSDGSGDVKETTTTAKGRMAAAFNLLQMGDDDEDDMLSDPERDAEADKEQQQAVAESTTLTKEEKKPKKKAKGKKAAAAEAADDDIDALLASLDQPSEPTTMSKKAKKKKKEEEALASGVAEPQTDTTTVDAAETDDLQTHPIVTTNDGERHHVDGEEKKKKGKKKKAAATGDVEATKEAYIPSESVELHDEVTQAADDDAKQDATDDEDDSKPTAKDDKKKKKKKEKEKKKDTKETKKKPTRADIIKEALRMKEEQERKIREEEEAEERRLDEIAKQKEEKLQKEKERKDKEKDKKKERIARQKREGTYMTAAQKEKFRLDQAKLEALKAQSGIVISGLEGAPKKKPVYGKLKKSTQPPPTKQSSIDSKEPSPTSAVTPAATLYFHNLLEEDGSAIHDDWETLDMPSDETTKETTEPLVQSTESTSAPSATAENGQAATAAAVESAGESSSSEEDEDEEESSSCSSEEQEVDKRPVKQETKEEMRERIMNRLKKRKADADAKRTTDDLRAPVVCVLGHVDTGKTKMLDTIRRTHVQDAEAGGITQQIGATRVPNTAIDERTRMVRDFKASEMKIPGFLIIDTPGHESFSNLRSRGSSLCDIAILVVDIMHGLEPQTLESIKLLVNGETPFVIALNKIDRLYEWKSNPNKDVRALLKSQKPNCQLEFEEHLNKVKVQFAEQGLNVALFWENTDPSEYISMVPTSAFMGDGVGNIMAYLADFAQTRLADRLAYSEGLRCTVLEVKSITGLGTTVDVILVNGRLKYGDTIVLAGTEGPIVTQIRELLMPQPMKELRVKNPYEHYKEVKGAQGVKICAKELEKALAGLPLYVARKEDEVDVLKDVVATLLARTLQSIRLHDRGVYVQASTLGSLEALIEFLKAQKIPYCGVNIGPVHKKDVVKCSTMLDHDPQLAVILAFDVKIERDAQTYADDVGVRIFAADIIYHLQDAFVKYREEYRERKRRENEPLAIFPCKLRVLPQFIFNSRNPIVCGVVVEGGIVKVGTPICVPSKECVFLGNVGSIEQNKKTVDRAGAGAEVCIKIENTTADAPKMYGRHFTHEDLLVSRISRESIDVCKEWFREDLTKPDWQLMVELKKLLDIY